jgi:hypothetical protein
MGSDDTQTIRIEAGKVGKFDQKCVNSLVKVTGVLVEQRVDEAYLENWENQLKAATAEKHGDSDAAGCSTESRHAEKRPTVRNSALPISARRLLPARLATAKNIFRSITLRLTIMKFKSNTLRKWSRAVHRDLSFFFSGMLLIYAVSGLVMNHRDSINPHYIIERKEYTLPAGQLTEPRR